MEEDVKERLLLRRRPAALKAFKVKDERVATVKKVAAILHKPEESRSPEENEILVSCSDIVKEVNLRQKKRDRVKARQEEVEDAPEILEEKCMRLAAAISRATSLAVYTGAGISTAASIPDYRGTNGVWTRMQQGKDIGEISSLVKKWEGEQKYMGKTKFRDIIDTHLPLTSSLSGKLSKNLIINRNHDLSQAEPTITHMALYALYKARVLKHIVSQNCDGLHLRSGIPRTLLSEVHGNMYVEVCKICKPSREYWRLFDVTEKTARYSHGTGRICHKCNSTLQDSIVHFGERGNLLWPINWSGASRAAKQADVILCLGSSLKVLKKYPWLWQMDKPMHKRSSLYIVNLQWTPKDENATLKINGKCDEVMKKVMLHLGIKIPEYNRGKDPIFHHAIRLQSLEQSTTTQPFLEEPVFSTEKSLIVVKEEEPEIMIVEPKSEPDCVTQIPLTEPMTAYPAPFFAALPFLSMGLPFPPMYMYPQLSPFLYYPFIQVPAITTEIAKPNPACSFCMENEGSLTCLYYQRDGDDPVTVDALPQETETEMENDSSLEQIQEAEAMSLDVNTPISTAKNPGWFGKGYRKGLKKKR